MDATFPGLYRSGVFIKSSVELLFIPSIASIRSAEFCAAGEFSMD